MGKRIWSWILFKQLRQFQQLRNCISVTHLGNNFLKMISKLIHFNTYFIHAKTFSRNLFKQTNTAEAHVAHNGAKISSPTVQFRITKPSLPSPMLSGILKWTLHHIAGRKIVAVVELDKSMPNDYFSRNTSKRETRNNAFPGRIQGFSQGRALSDGLVFECYWIMHLEWWNSIPGVGARPSAHPLHPRLHLWKMRERIPFSYLGRQEMVRETVGNNNKNKQTRKQRRKRIKDIQNPYIQSLNWNIAHPITGWIFVGAISLPSHGVADGPVDGTAVPSGGRLWVEAVAVNFQHAWAPLSPGTRHRISTPEHQSTRAPHRSTSTEHQSTSTEYQSTSTEYRSTFTEYRSTRKTASPRQNTFTSRRDVLTELSAPQRTSQGFFSWRVKEAENGELGEPESTATFDFPKVGWRWTLTSSWHCHRVWQPRPSIVTKILVCLQCIPTYRPLPLTGTDNVCRQYITIYLSVNSHVVPQLTT